MNLLQRSASLAILLRVLVLSPPPTPMSFKKPAIEAAGKPRQPTSTAQILTVHPFLFPSTSRGAYFVLLSSPDTSIQFSPGTVSSKSPILLVFFEMRNISSGPYLPLPSVSSIARPDLLLGSSLLLHPCSYRPAVGFLLAPSLLP